jgi:hypothetical protein
MSRSNNVEIINPSVRFYEWAGGEGCMKFFVKLPFSFLVLDILHTIRGFSDSDQSGFWSNEVRDIKTEALTVRTKKGIVATDVYKNLAPVLNQGAAYCQSVYIASKDEAGKLMICNFQIKGSAIGEWITTCKGKNIYKYAVSIVGATPAKKGKTEYFTPVFKLSPTISEETEVTAQYLDKELQEFLTAYFKRTNNIQNAAAPAVAINETVEFLNTELSNDASNLPDANDITEPIDDLPF